MLVKPTQVFKIGATETGFVKGRQVGLKQYELKDHLGNVRAVVSDVLVPHDNTSDDVIDELTAKVESATDYYPFGMQMPKRNYTCGDGYRYGFNGKEKVNEVNGTENTQDFGARMYDARIGRFFKTDPAHSGFSFETPYAFAGNTPIWAIDKEGEKIYFVGSAMSNQALQEAYNTLVQTPSGRKLLAMYESSNTHDIYIVTSNFKEGDKAVATTLNNIRTANFPNGKISLNHKDDEESKVKFKEFQGLDVSRSKGAVSLITLNLNYFEQNINPTIDKYKLAEVLYHEIYAHLFIGSGTESYQHDLYGKTYYGFYLETVIPLPLDYDNPDNRNGLPTQKYDYDIVPEYSPAFSIMQELLNLKQKWDKNKIDKKESKVIEAGKKSKQKHRKDTPKF